MNMAAASSVGGGLRPGTGDPMLGYLTLVLWTGCLAVGIVGLVIPHARPQPPAAPEPPPVQVERIQVELSPDPVAQPADSSPPPDLLVPPPLPQAAPPPAAPELLAVAEPGPAVAFSMPVGGPARVVPVEQAASGAAVQADESAAGTAAAIPVQPLQFGVGEGRQPAPPYPPAARKSGQEGKVLVLFTVGAGGEVLSAEAQSPSPWPLLDESAVRAVRERWRFKPGPLRRHVVEIIFQLHR